VSSPAPTRHLPNLHSNGIYASSIAQQIRRIFSLSILESSRMMRLLHYNNDGEEEEAKTKRG
jgi:hypothetical protein